MVIGVILPHTGVYGGVKRFLELGNRFVANGHRFIIFCPEKCWPHWFEYHGNTDMLSNLQKYECDVIFFTEINFLSEVLKAKSKVKIFYHVYRRNYLKKLKKHPDILVYVNSTNIYRYNKLLHPRRTLYKAIGGVEMHDYQTSQKNQNDQLNILTYGRLSRKKKGTHLVVNACEQLQKKGYNLKLILFDTPVDDESKKLIKNFQSTVPFEFILNKPFRENADFFRKADIFVSAEKKAGWSNTSAEAMAIGLPVVATKSGTMDFLHHKKTGILVNRNSRSIRNGIELLIKNPDMCNRISKTGHHKIQQYSWEHLYTNIINQLEEHIYESKY